MARFEPVPFAQRSEGQKVIIGAVIPALVGALAGFLVGASAAGYWVVAILAAVGAFLSGFEHPADVVVTEVPDHADLVRHDRFAELKADYLASGGARSNLRYGYVARPV